MTDDATEIIKKKEPIDYLLSYQIPHVYQMYESLLETNCVLDASDTGTGKTYTNIAVCHLLNLKPFIICPKSVINSWITVSQHMGVEILGLSNYEKIKGGKYYTTNYEIAECPYLDIIIGEDIPKKIKKDDLKKDMLKDMLKDVLKDELKKDGLKDDLKKCDDQPKAKDTKLKKKKEYVFQFPIDTIIIIDEVHRCKNHQSSNSKLMLSLKDSQRKIIMLSATITDKIECFKPFGVMFGFYDNIYKYKMWLTSKIDNKKLLWDKLRAKDKTKKPKEKKKDVTDDAVLKIIHKAIYPQKGSRMKIKELGDLFPQNQVLAKCYYSDDHEKVDELYNMINKALDDIKIKEKRSFALGEIMRCRMRLEMLKLPIILDLIDDALENNYSVVIFVNFRDSMSYLTLHLKEECSHIHGDQSIDERSFNINNFQENKTKIIISTITAGGVGISLHDLHGKPRMSIISPNWSGTDIVQALGRIHRAGSKSPALQRIVYIAKSYEEKICQTLSSKLQTLSAINDGDFSGLEMTTEKLKEMGELDTINKNVIHIEDEYSDTDSDKEEEKPKKVKKEKTVIKKKKFVIIQNDDEEDFKKEKNLKYNYMDNADDDDKSKNGKLDGMYKMKK